MEAAIQALGGVDSLASRQKRYKVGESLEKVVHTSYEPPSGPRRPTWRPAPGGGRAPGTAAAHTEALCGTALQFFFGGGCTITSRRAAALVLGLA